MSYWDRAPLAPEVRQTAQRVLDLAFEMHTELGPGFVESIYRKCFVHLLKIEGLRVDEHRPLTVSFRGLVLDRVQVVDIYVEPGVVVELKSVERLAAVHQAQLISYLKATGAQAGLLINFNAKSLRDGFERCVRPDLVVENSVDSADSEQTNRGSRSR